MKNLSRIIFFIGAIALLGTFLSPIWRITLEAPQYPSGVTMYIWVNKLGGSEKGTLQNINILNHYVGMKMIEPESIPELKIFPKVIIGMTVLGLILGFVNNKKLWLGWAIVLLVLGIVGVYDFYLWEYDYGHDLAPDAPIKVPGQAYQPPLIGSKMLLNFNAISYPYYGSIFIGIALIFPALAFYMKKKSERN